MDYLNVTLIKILTSARFSDGSLHPCRLYAIKVWYLGSEGTSCLPWLKMKDNSTRLHSLLLCYKHLVFMHTLAHVFLQNELSQRHNYFYRLYLRYEVLTALTVKITILWHVTPCSLVHDYQHFRVMCYLHFQAR